MRADCLCTWVPYGDTEVFLTAEGCPRHGEEVEDYEPPEPERIDNDDEEVPW